MHIEEVDETLPPIAESDGVAERLARKTPWWAISVGLHSLAVLFLGFFWVVQAETETLPITMPKTRPPKVPIFNDPHTVKSPVHVPLPDNVSDPLVTREQDKSFETANEEDTFQAKGASMEFVSVHPFNGRGSYSTIGGGGGGGGKKGGPFGGRIYRTKGCGGTPETEDAVKEALKWLARHQNPDGSWGVQGYVKQCKEGACSPNPGHEDFDAGVTGLSLLAFLGAGFSHLSKDIEDGICFGDVVRKGLQWMMGHQDTEGCIGSRNAQKYMYNHTVCALAMTEAFGLTGSSLFKDQAQKAVDFVLAAQNPGKGWRYSAKSGDNDSSVTGWAVMVLKSAELSNLSIPRTGYDGTRAWYDEVTEPNYARVGYSRMGDGKVYIPGMNEQYDHHEALTSIGVMARIFIDKNKSDARLVNGCDLLLRDKPRWDGNAIDFYYWYYASLALFQFDGPSGPKWKAWNEPMKAALVGHQNKFATGCRRGSWEPVDRWSCEGGRVYGTAINALTLEVYYRYVSVFGAGR